MKWFELIISVLAVWRITHLLQAEDGPWDIIIKIRSFLGNGFFGALMDCFYCLSIWIALPLGFYFGDGWIEKILLWFAYSGGAVFLQKISSNNKEG